MRVKSFKMFIFIYCGVDKYESFYPACTAHSWECNPICNSNIPIYKSLLEISTISFESYHDNTKYFFLSEL